jgi:hypothetical protein
MVLSCCELLAVSTNNPLSVDWKVRYYIVHGLIYAYKVNRYFPWYFSVRSVADEF